MSEARANGGVDAARLIKLLGVLALCGALLQAGKTIQFPNLWAATHLNFDYHFGFLKRSLLGAVLRGVGWDMGTYGNVCVLGFGGLAAVVGALILLGRRAGLRLTVAGAFLGLVFWSSYGFGYTVHLVAYTDHVLLLLALLSCLALGRLPQLPAVAVACVLGVVGTSIHENYGAACVPVVVACCLLQRRYAGAVAYGTVMVVTLLAVLRFGLPAEGVVTKAEMLRHYQSVMSYRLRPDAFEVFFRDAAANLQGMQERWTYRAHWVHWTLSLVVFLSSALVLLVPALTAGRAGARDAVHRGLVTAGLIGATLAPLFLHVFGWDMHRWNAMTVVNAFVVLCLARIAAGRDAASAEPSPPPWRLYRWGLLAVFLSLATGFGLLNRMDVTSAPFTEHVDYWLDVFAGEAPFPRVPGR